MSEEDVRQLLSTCDFTVHQIDYRQIEHGARFEYKMIVQTIEVLNMRRLAEKLRERPTSSSSTSHQLATNLSTPQVRNSVGAVSLWSECPLWIIC